MKYSHPSHPRPKKRHIIIPVLACVLLGCHPRESKTGAMLFKDLYARVDQKRFIEAEALLHSRQQELSEAHLLVIGAMLDNAFNRLIASENKVHELKELTGLLPDSLNLRINQLRADNSIKRFHYAEAAETITGMLDRYRSLIPDTELEEWENALKIWEALKDVPAQKISRKQATTLPMEQDVAGLNTLPVSVGRDTLPFVFDTGANLSTTSRSIAERMKMELIPVSIEVGTITGAKVPAQLAVCPHLTLGAIAVENAIFLVLPDEALSFPQMNYQIYGILGYPILEALEEIRISREGEFIVPDRETNLNGTSNLALDGLSPIIFLEGKPYALDSGADHTLLYHRFFKEHQKEIETQYELTEIRFGGAGGETALKGYEINFSTEILGRKIELQKVAVLMEKVGPGEVVYGNIGQDVIGQFHTMILNFNQMFIKFE